MKTTCTKCGKRFNAEQHMYICPKCNHYHSQVGSRSSLNTDEKPIKKYRWETDPIELDDEENFFKRRRKETERCRPRNRSSLLGRILLYF